MITFAKTTGLIYLVIDKLVVDSFSIPILLRLGPDPHGPPQI